MPKISINYDKTIIYQIKSKNSDITDVYIGHTVNFRMRKSQHKRSCNNPDSKSYNFKLYQRIRETGGWEEWIMIEIEKYKCNDGNEARARERHFYDLYQAKLNTYRPFINRVENLERQKQYNVENADRLKEYRTEYYTDNADKIKEYQTEYNIENADRRKEYQTEYRLENADKIKEKMNEKTECECGGKYTKSNQAIHFKSKRHINFLKTITNV